jgi:uncharacterized protein YdeI (YjbR/CyaY-like superfamily)
MAAVVPDPRRIQSFRSAAAFEKWLATHHDKWPELWLKVHKKGSGLATVTAPEALDVCLCWGWIDGIRKTFDEKSFLQRYTPRRKTSTWSQVNREHVARLVAARRMTPHGLRQIEAAKADGRWDAAYVARRSITVELLPADLRAAIEANARARKRLATLGRADLFSLGARTNRMRTGAGRARKIEELVGMVARGEAIAQENPRATGKTGASTPRRPRR